jgi:hypothetical protein
MIVTKKVINESKKGKIMLFHQKATLLTVKLQGISINQEVRKTIKSKTILQTSHAISDQIDKIQTSLIVIFLGQKTLSLFSNFIIIFVI